MILTLGPSGDHMGVAALALGVSSCVALLGYGTSAALDERRRSAVRVALLAGWLAHALAILVDITGFGLDRVGPRFGFAPALSVTLWLVLAVYGIESRSLPLSGARRPLALVGLAVVALAWAFPGAFHPSAPTRWSPVHWVLGIASYGLFGVAVFHAALLSRAERQMRRRSASDAAPGIPLLRLERLTFRFVGAGFVVLSAALLLGAWNAHPWRWDHKTVFSLLGWVVFAGLLAGRRAFGWRGPLATRWMYAGAALLLLGYVGSRFVLEVLLQRPTGA